MKHFSLPLIIAIAISGCASVPKGDPIKDAQAKTFIPVQDKAALYIYRNESIGAAVKMDVAVDGEPIGKTGAKTYLYKEVTPGKHFVSSVAENTDRVEVDVKPGTLTFIWQEVKMGILYARTKLHLVSEDEGKKGVLETSMAATN